MSKGLQTWQITFLVYLVLKNLLMCSCVLSPTLVVFYIVVICLIVRLLLRWIVLFQYLIMVPLLLQLVILSSNLRLLILGFKSSMHVHMMLLMILFKFVMGLFVSWFRTTSALLFRLLIRRWLSLYLVIYILLLLVATWVVRSLYMLFRGVSFGIICIKIVKSFVKSVKFVNKIEYQLKSSMVNCNLCLRLLGLLLKLLWIL